MQVVRRPVGLVTTRQYIYLGLARMSSTNSKTTTQEGACKAAGQTGDEASKTPQGQGPPGPWGWGWFGGQGGAPKEGTHQDREQRWAEWQKIMEKRRKENCKCEKKGAETSEAKCDCPPGPPHGRRGNGPPPYWVMMMMSGMGGKGGPKDGPQQWGPPPGVDCKDGPTHRDGPPPEVIQQMMQGGGWFSGWGNMFGWGGGKHCAPVEGGHHACPPKGGAHHHHHHHHHHHESKCHGGKDFSKEHSCSGKKQSCSN